jgi:hypothetical protein
VGVADWIDKVMDWPWRDWAGYIITGAFTLMGTVVVVGQKRSQSSREREQDARDRQAIRDKEERDRDAKQDEVQTQDLTARFRALMDGYELRIKDQAADNMMLRDRLRKLEHEFEIYKGICEGCAKRAEKLRELDGRSA